MIVDAGTSSDDAARPSDPADDGGHFHIFVYGTLSKGGIADSRLAGCEYMGEAVVEGTLYDLGDFPALILYGSTPVRGDVWRCPAALLAELDQYEQIETGLFRRVALTAGEFACWTYVAGPGLAQRLTPERRLSHGEWSARGRG